MDIVSKDKTNAPIGLFDSGVGGLSIYQHLYNLLPHEYYVYFADTEHVPYGKRNSAEIKQLTLQAVSRLVDYGCKLVVIACNSASAYGLQEARKQHPNVPIVGLVPALKPAVLASNTKHVAVLATQATLQGNLLNKVIQEIAIPNQVKVTKMFNPNLVPWVEQGMPSDSETAKQLINSLHQFRLSDVDHIVLGCTHYPFFKKFLLKEIDIQQWNIQLVDSGQAIANRVQQLLTQYKLLNSHQDTQLCSEVKVDAKLDFSASKNIQAVSLVAERLLQKKVKLIE